MRTIPTTTTTSLAPAASLASAQAQRSSWHSPIPYLFGGLAAMLGLIAFALLILACSYWKLSGHLQNEENGESVGDEKPSDSANKEPVKVYEEKILVIMAGDEKPTFLATPASANSSSIPHALGNDSAKHLQNHDTCHRPDKQMDPHVQPATPQPQTQQQQS